MTDAPPPSTPPPPTPAAPEPEPPPEHHEPLLETVHTPEQMSVARTVLHVVSFMLRRVLLGRRVLWNLLLIILPLAVSILVAKAAGTIDEGPQIQGQYFYLAVSALHFPIVVPVFALIFASSFPWPQADEGALTYWFTSPAPRWAVVVGRFVAAVLAGWMLLPFSVLAIGLPLDVPEGQSIGAMMLRTIAVTWVIYPAYLALFGLLSTITRRALPVAVAILLVENVLSAFGGVVPLLTVVHYSRTLFWHGVPLELRNFAEDVLLLEETLKLGDPLPQGECLVILLGVTFGALAVAALFTHLLEFRGKNLQAT